MILSSRIFRSCIRRRPNEDAPRQALASPASRSPCRSSSTMPSDEDLQFVNQLRMPLREHRHQAAIRPPMRISSGSRIEVEVGQPASLEHPSATPTSRNMEEVALHLPGRDKKIEGYRTSSEIWAERGFTARRMRTWATASGALQAATSREQRSGAPVRFSHRPGHWANKEFKVRRLTGAFSARRNLG